MKVKVVGKEFVEGVSRKTGKDYAFINVYYTAQASGIEGVSASHVTVDPTFISYGDIAVDYTYDLDFDQRGRLVAIYPC